MSRIAHPGDDHNITLEQAREVAKRLARNVERMYTDHYETFELLLHQLDDLRLRMQNEKPIRGNLIPGATDAVVKSNVMSFLGPKDLANLSAVSKPLRQVTWTFEQALHVAQRLIDHIDEQHKKRFRRDVQLDGYNVSQETKEIFSDEHWCHPALVAMAFTHPRLATDTRVFSVKDPKYAIYVEFLHMLLKDSGPVCRYLASRVLQSLNADMIRKAFLTQIVTSRLRGAFKDPDKVSGERVYMELKDIAMYINQSPLRSSEGYTTVRAADRTMLNEALPHIYFFKSNMERVIVTYNPYLVDPVSDIDSVIKPIGEVQNENTIVPWQ